MSQYFDNKDLFLQPKVTQYGNHMVMTNVQKQPKTKYYNIDTRFRDDYDESHNSFLQTYNISLPERINDVKSIMVCNAEIPLSYYNISNSLENNAFQIVDENESDPISKTIVIRDGHYDSITLATEINFQFNLVGLSDITFILSSNNSGFQTANSSYKLYFAVKTNMLTSGDSQTSDFDKYNFNSKLGWLLGFRNIEYSFSQNSIQLSEAFIDLNGPRYLYLVVDEFNNGNQNSFLSPMHSSLLNKNILAKITPDNAHYEFGKVLVANLLNGLLLTDKRSYNGKADLQRLKIQLVNEKGIPMNLNGLDFSFSLEVEYE
jgi:hypothetical protein